MNRKHLYLLPVVGRRRLVGIKYRKRRAAGRGVKIGVKPNAAGRRAEADRKPPFSRVKQHGPQGAEAIAVGVAAQPIGQSGAEQSFQIVQADLVMRGEKVLDSFLAYGGKTFPFRKARRVFG